MFITTFNSVENNLSYSEDERAIIYYVLFSRCLKEAILNNYVSTLSTGLKQLLPYLARNIYTRVYNRFSKQKSRALAITVQKILEEQKKE